MTRILIFLIAWLIAPLLVFLVCKGCGLPRVWPGVFMSAASSLGPAIIIAQNADLRCLRRSRER